VALDVVAEERGRRELAPALDDQVVRQVVHVDEESAGDDAGRERSRAREDQAGAGGEHRGHEVAARAHVRDSIDEVRR